MSIWIVKTENGSREWEADDAAHALEQHDDAFPDEAATAVTLAGVSEPRNEDRIRDEIDKIERRLTGMGTRLQWEALSPVLDHLYAELEALERAAFPTQDMIDAALAADQSEGVNPAITRRMLLAAEAVDPRMLIVEAAVRWARARGSAEMTAVEKADVYNALSAAVIKAGLA